MALEPKIDPDTDPMLVGSTLPNPASGQADAVPVISYLLRDAGVVLFALAVCYFTELGLTGLDVSYLPWLATPVSFFVGLLVFSKSHEWGHFSGARLTGGHAPTTAKFGRLFIFQFNMIENSRQQFLAMGVGGQLAGIIPLLLSFIFLPFSPGAIGFQAAGLYVVIAAFSTDAPVIARSLQGASNQQAWLPHYHNIKRNRKRAYRNGKVSVLIYALAMSGYWLLSF